MYVDRYLRRGQDFGALAQDVTRSNPAGVIAMAVGLLISVPLFSNQEKYTGLVPQADGNFGDLTAVVGFVVAAALYAVLYKPLSRDRSVA